MDEDDRNELILGLFAVLTADLEDAAGLAADGQGQNASRQQRNAIAAQVYSTAQRAMIVADAVHALLEA